MPFLFSIKQRWKIIFLYESKLRKEYKYTKNNVLSSYNKPQTFHHRYCHFVVMECTKAYQIRSGLSFIPFLGGKHHEWRWKSVICNLLFSTKAFFANLISTWFEGSFGFWIYWSRHFRSIESLQLSWNQILSHCTY